MDKLNHLYQLKAAAEEKDLSDSGAEALIRLCKELPNEAAGLGLVPTTCIEHGPGGTIRLSYQIKVF